MKNRFQVLALLATIGTVSLSGCLVGRVVSISDTFDHPNTITDRGFTYTRKGVEVRYVVDGIFPSKHPRSALLGHLSVAHNAYAKLWQAAGGLQDNQRFVNIVIEASFVKKVGFANELFLVVHVYADVIQFDAAPGATRPADPARHAGTSQVVRQIARSVEQAATRRRS